MRIRAAATLMAVLFLWSVVYPASLPRVILIHIVQPPVPWAESRIAGKLETHFGRDPRLRTRIVKSSELGVRSVETDSVLATNNDQKSTFLLTVTIQSERIDRRKGFKVPLLFHRWETVGIVEGEFRLLDVQRGKLLAAEPFAHELKGPAIFQGSMDDNRDDPDIHLRAPEKALFVSALEEALVTMLVERTRALLGSAGSHDREFFTQKARD